LQAMVVNLRLGVFMGLSGVVPECFVVVSAVVVLRIGRRAVSVLRVAARAEAARSWLSVNEVNR